MVPVFKNVGESSTAKNYALLAFFLWLVQSLKNLCIIGLLITWKNVAFSLISSMVLGLLDQLQMVWDRSGTTRAVALDISKAFDKVWHACRLRKLKSYEIWGQIFGLISSFLSNRRLRVVLNGNSSQEYPVNAGVPQGSILGPTLTLMTLLMMLSVILLTMLMILLSTLSLIRHLICGNNYNWLLKLDLIYETLYTEVGSDLLISMMQNSTGFVWPV